MTMTLDDAAPKLDVGEPADRAPYDMREERRRIDGNFVVVEEAINKMRAEMAAAVKAAKKPHRPPRTGAAARVNADDIRFFRFLLGANVIFAAAAVTASYAGQYAMAPHTYLPTHLWWVVPLFIDIPLVINSGTIMVFRRRGQSVILPWTLISGLTIVSSAINIIHVLSESGVLAGAPLTVETVVGATVMGLTPLLILLGWEEIVRLGVKPPTRAERIENGVKVAPAPTKRKK